MIRAVQMVAAGLLVQALASPVAARADDEERARELFKEANRLRREKSYAQALERYRAAYRLLPSFKINYNIGLTLEHMGQKGGAADAYERFLEAAPGRSPARMIDLAREKLLRLEQQVGALVIRGGAAGARVSVDRTPVGLTPLRRRIFLDPGEHEVLVEGAGQARLSTRLQAVAGQTRVLDVAPHADAPASPAGSTPTAQPLAGAAKQGQKDSLRVRRESKTRWAFIGLGAGLACAIAAGVLYGVGQSQGDQAYQRYSDAGDQDQMDRHWEEVEGAERLFVGGHVLVAAAVLAGAFSIYQLATRPPAQGPASSTPPGPRWGVALGPLGAGLTVSGLLRGGP